MGRMIPRYARPEMAALFTDEARLARWLEVEVLVAEALASEGAVPGEGAQASRGRGGEGTGAFGGGGGERERVRGHDGGGFVGGGQTALGPPAGRCGQRGRT